MMNPLLGRQIKITTSIVCDYEHPENPLQRVIPKGKIGYQIVGDEEVLAQGIFHGRFCHEAAVANYKEKLKEIKGETNE